MSLVQRHAPMDGTPPGPTAAREAAWRNCIKLFAVTLVAGIALCAVTILAFDPYDSGRFPTFMPAGISDNTPRTANASRGRDLRFNSVVIGNSHTQLVDPARLSSATGLRFVQMTVPGTGPREQMTLLRYFMRHHQRVGAIVIGVDDLWCMDNSDMQMINPFPFWLYGNTVDYVTHSLGSRAFVLIWRRVLIALDRLQPTDPAGYWDYELGRERAFHPTLDDVPVVDLSPRKGPPRLFPALDLLDRTIADLPSDTPVIVMMPPRFRSAMPAPDTDAQKTVVACKAEIIRRFSEKPGRLFADFLTDTPVNRDPVNYMDDAHYRAPVARMIEQRLSREILAQAPRPAGASQ